MSLFDRVKNKYLQENKYAKNTPAGDPLSFIAQDQFVRKGRIRRRRGAIQQAAVNLGKAVKKQAEIDAASDALNDMKASGKMGKITPDVSKQMRSIEGDPQSNKIRAEIEKQTGQKTREFTQRTGVTKGNEGKSTYKPPSKAESDAIQTRSLNRKTKEFVNRPRSNTTKSKGGGASTGGRRIQTPNPKSKGTAPVKVNVTQPVKQSEVSRRAKTYTADINKANKKRQQTVRGRRANRIKDATGGKKTGSLRGGNLSFAGDRSGAYQQKKVDIEARKLLRKAGASGDFSPTMPQDKRKAKQKIRTTRTIKQGTPDPFKIDTSKAAKEVAKDFGSKPVKGGLDFGKPGTGIKDTIKNFQPRDTSTRRAAEKAEKSFKAFQDRLSKQGTNIKQSKIYAKPRSASASTGGGANYSSTSFRTGNMKGGRTRKPFDSMGGGRKPPFGGGRSTAAGAGGIDPEIVSGKFIPNTKTKVPKVSKIPKVRGGGKIGTVLAVAATAPYVYDAIKRGRKQKEGKKKFLDINKDFERVKS